MTQTASRAWTFIGLAVALFAIPAIASLHQALATPPSTATQSGRELMILLLTGFLIWIVLTRERLPLSSIGLRTDHPVRSLIRGTGLTLVILASLIACLLVFGALGIRYGEDSAISRSLPVTFLTIVRAAVAEELFYRGYALERIEALAGSKWIAAAVTLTLFAGFHYRQGLAGMTLVLVVGAILTGFYMWKRDLMAAVAAHFLVDFIPNILLPLLAGDPT